VLRSHVTLGADPGICHFEEPVVDGAMRLVTVRAVLQHRGVLPEKRAAPLRVARVTIFIDARLFELRGIGRAMGIVTVGARELPFPDRHVRRAHQLRFSLQMTLAADFGLSALVKEGSLIADLSKLEAIGGLLHNHVAVHASDPAARVGARLPIGLKSPLVTSKTDLALDPGGLSGVLAKCNQSAHASAATGGYVVASRAVTGFARLFFKIVAGVEQKNLAHQCLGEFLELGRVAGLADLSSYVRGFLRRLHFCRPEGMSKEKKEERH